jgi:hypothetical protein
VIDGIELQLDDFAVGHPFRYRAAFKAVGLEPVTIAGAMIYDDAAAKLSLRDSVLKAEGVDFEVSGAVGGLSRAPAFNLSIANDGFEIKPLIQRLKKSGWLAREVAASGVAGVRLRLTGPSNNLVAEVDARPKGVEIDDPLTFKGIIAGDIALAAPLAADQPLLGRLGGSGRLSARDGALTHVDLVRQIEQTAGSAPIGKQPSGATTFTLATIDFTLGGGLVELNRIGLESPIMDARGRGRLFLATQTIAMTLQAALTPAVAARLASVRRPPFASDARGRMMVPLRISGPIAHPAVNIDAPKAIARCTAPPPRAGTAASTPAATKTLSLFGAIFGTTQENSWRDVR